jgi:hypothetical protein
MTLTPKKDLSFITAPSVHRKQTNFGYSGENTRSFFRDLHFSNNSLQKSQASLLNILPITPRLSFGKCQDTMSA